MVQVQVFQVGEMPQDQGHVLLLRAEGDDRVLPIGIGSFEAMSIATGVAGVRSVRPFPYELLTTIIGRLGGQLKQVVIHDLRDQTFIGQLEIVTQAGVIEVDCRPSDAVALALRTEGCPIFVTEEVLDQAAAPLPPADDEETPVID